MNGQAQKGSLKDQLLTEVDALIRLYDVKEHQRLREQLQGQWWESGLRILVFISGLGLLITAYKLIPHDSQLLFGFVFSWVFLFVITLLAIVEHLLHKIRALCRAYELQHRLLEHILKELRPLLRGEGISAPPHKSG